jgi:eukaryotic-like serine/threonine-protein kinase
LATYIASSAVPRQVDRCQHCPQTILATQSLEQMKTTLSNTQWQHLQALFDRAEQMDMSAADALIASLRPDDALIAETLAAMLSAHRQWQQRTGVAIETLAAAASPSAVGARLGAFTLVKEIGRGGMGTVYLGERADGQVQQQVAIKVLHARNLDDNTRARFQREREILASFDHPGIARLLDVGESDAGEPYYVMEYLRGLPIDAHCDQHRLSIRERLNLFRGICDAVQYAHGKLILHRDIKPSNIIVDAAGMPKLIDFGIAKPIHLLDAATVEETATHQRYFSPVNAAPEQIRGESVSVACDVYQLGTLLHELLTGKPIFDLQGSSTSDLERRISSVIPAAPSRAAESVVEEVAQARALDSAKALSRALRGDLDAIVQRAVRKEPHQRYASVEQMSQDIERHLRDEPVLGRRGDRAYHFSRFVKRHRRALAIATLSTFALITFTALLLVQVQRTTVERDRALEASKRAEAVTQFLVEIFESGDPAKAMRPDAPISYALQRGRDLLGERLQDDPLMRARLLQTLSTIYVSLDDTETAGALMLESVGLSETLTVADPLAFARRLQYAGSIMAMNGKFEDSRAILNRVMSVYQSMNAGTEVSWYTQMFLLKLRARDGGTEACNQLDALSMRLLDMGPEWSDEAARVYLTAAYCGPPTRARLDWLDRHALALIHEQNKAETPNQVSIFRANQIRVTVLQQLWRVDEADALNREIFKSYKSVYGEDSWVMTEAIHGFGITALQRRDYSEAKARLLQADALYAQLAKGKPHPDIAFVSNSLGRLYELGFNDVDTALRYHAKATEVGRIGEGPGSSCYGMYAADYALLLLKRGESAKAEPLLREVIRILPADQSHGARSRIGLAKILAERGDSTEAVSLLKIPAKTLIEVERDAPGSRQQWEMLSDGVRGASHVK